jgi:hypothetical protein
MFMLSIICILLLSGTASAHVRTTDQQLHNSQEMKYAIQQVQKISSSNSAAFVMNFSIQYLNPNTGETGNVGGTDNYPVGQQRTIDLDTLSIPDGSLVRPSVNAILGASNPGNQYVRYVKGNGGVATYNVTGTTLNFSVSLVQ